MKRKVKETAGQSPAVSVVVEALLDDPQVIKGMYVGKAIDDRLIGLPGPGLSLMYCMDSTVLPLGKMIGIAGPSQSQKTSLALELARVGLGLGGYCFLVDNEAAKYSPSLYRSILGIEDRSPNLIVSSSDSVEESQKRLTDFVKVFHEKRVMSEVWTMILDSLSGTEPEGEMKKIDSEGSAGRAHPVLALSWTRYLRWLTARINAFPILFISINHLKDKPPPPGQMFGGKSTPGGAAQRFHAMVYFWVKRLGMSRDSESRVTWDFPFMEDGKINPGTASIPIEIRKIEIECEKNSQGVDSREITVDFCFFNDLKERKRAFFDWNGSTARLLFDLQEKLGVIVEEGQENRYGRLKEILEIGCDRARYSCPELGLKGVSGQVLGFSVHQNPKLMAKLIKFFGIKEGQIWNGRMPDPPVPSLLDFKPPPADEASKGSVLDEL